MWQVLSTHLYHEKTRRVLKFPRMTLRRLRVWGLFSDIRRLPPLHFIPPDFISQNVQLEWFQNVNSPTTSSTNCADEYKRLTILRGR